jgi:7-keto-8-aminopelargonate synthetase-like enzyme
MPAVRDPLLPLRAAATRDAAGLRRALRPRNAGSGGLIDLAHSVPPGRSCLRLTIRASLSEADFAAVTRALAEVADHVRMAMTVGRN